MKVKIAKLFKIKGGWIENYGGIYVLSYGKSDSIKLLKKMYYYRVRYFLNRKFKIARQFMGE